MSDPFSGAEDALEAAGVIDGPLKKERVRVTGQPSALADKLGLILGKPGRLYLRGEAVCYIGESAAPPFDPQFKDVSPEFFATWAEKYVTFVKPDGEAGEKLVGIKADMTRVILASPQFRAHLPKVRRVNRVPMPVMRKDGRIELLREGYDEESGTFTFQSAVQVQRIPLKDAVRWLLDLYGECLFPLVEATVAGEKVTVPDPRSLAVALAMPVSLFVSRLLPTMSQRLGFLVTADGAGAGKTTIAMMAQAAVLGVIDMMTWGRDEDQLRTRVDAAMLSGDATILFDNVKNRINSDLIESLMTSPTHKVRLFHSQRNALVPNETTVIVTSNSAEASSDADRRFLLCALELATSDPREVKRKRDLTASLLCSVEHRSAFLSAMWSVVAAWDEAGRPGAQACIGGEMVQAKGVSGYGDFCRVVGGVMGVMSCESEGRVGDPFAAPPAELSPDTETRDMRLLIARLTEGAGNSVEVAFEDVVRWAASMGLFGWLELPAIEDVNDADEVKRALTPSMRSKFGKFFARKSSEGKPGKPGKRYTLARGEEVETWGVSHTGHGVRRVFRLALQ